MFWLLYFFTHDHRRRESFNNFTTAFKTPQSRGILFKLIAMLLGAAMIWWIIAAILSLLNAWFVVLLTMVLGGVVGFFEWRKNRREGWIQSGCCAQCGYDLRGTPDRCPECGRDVHLDEPIWKRIRRELEAKLLAQADAAETANPATPAATEISDGTPRPRVVIKPPPPDDKPIALEGDPP